jgi:hypothetical protein
MTEGKSRGDWGIASVILAAIYNTVRDAKKRPKPFTPKDFNPYAEDTKPKPLRTISITEWRDMCQGRSRTQKEK